MRHRVPVLCLLSLLALAAAAVALEPTPPPLQGSSPAALDLVQASPGLGAVLGVPAPAWMTCVHNTCWDDYWTCARGCTSGDSNCIHACEDERTYCQCICSINPNSCVPPD